MAEKTSWVFIVNPTAGGGSGKEMVPEIEKQLTERSVNGTIRLTQEHGHATQLSEEAADAGNSHIIAVGGDGTMNEVARPLLGKEGITIGLVPAGTGNDFNQILGFPDRFTGEDWNAFFQANTTRMDAGQVNGICFLNGMGLGFDAQVAAENYVEPGEVVEGTGKRKYLYHILKTLLFYREGRATISSRGRNGESDCFMNTVANGRRFAGSFHITPDAIANDGLLDVCLIKRLNLFHRLRILTMVPKGTHVKDHRVDTYQTERITVDFGKKVPFHVDGELYFDSRFDIHVLPAAFTIIYNPEGPHYFK